MKQKPTQQSDPPVSTTRQISKRLRFEILKRDKFRCIYCGRAAPDVILHVDHVVPVKSGGETEQLNLASACRDCNLGKAAVPLPNDSALQKQRVAFEERAARKEQIEMMAQWARDLADAKNLAADAVITAIERRMAEAKISDTPWLNEIGVAGAKRWAKKFPLADLLEAIEDAADNHLPASFDTFWSMVPRYAARKPQLREKPHLRDLFYAAAILRNKSDGRRFVGPGENVVDVLDSYVPDVTPAEIVALAKSSRYPREFFDELRRICDERERVS